ncbi:MAG: hypothetical protein WAO35_12325, partial [Terriglobia bacterium]
MMLEAHLRQASTALLESAIRIAPPYAREWGRAMEGEINYVEGSWAVAMWALGGAGVLAKQTLASLFIPGRRGHGMAPDGGLFAKTVSLRKAMLAICGGCVLAALLFFAAPPFRQGIRISLAGWQNVLFVTPSGGQPGLAALAQGAEARHDPEGLAFCAVRLQNSHESARLAQDAVGLDPTLIWVYAVVAVRHPDLPQISQWMSKLQQWDPQNALFPLITAESIDIYLLNKARGLSPDEIRREWAKDPVWQNALAAAFVSTKFDDYLDRLKQIDRRVVLRYRFSDPDELLSGDESDLPSYAFWDCQRFAKSLLQSGNGLEVQGDRKGAAERYWAVARFGQMMDSEAHSDDEGWVGLQAMAYKELQALSAKEGNPGEAALFSYLGEKFDPARTGHALVQERMFDRDIVLRNAAVLQISSLMMIIFSGVIVLAALVLIVASRRGARPATQRFNPVTTVVALAGAVGLLVSSATVYLTYRPYWYILQSTILNGDRSHARDLREFLMAAQVLPGSVSDSSYLLRNFRFYFWTGVTLLGVIGLALILLRHFLGR